MAKDKGGTASSNSSKKKGHKARVKEADKKVNRVRNVIFVALAVIVGGVVGYGVLYSTGATNKLVTDGVEEGDHYTLLKDPPERRPRTPVVVTEYFSYGCIHCKNFDPHINEFAADLPDGVKFERVPVSFSPEWALLAQAYLALESTGALELNHERLFRAIHDSRRRFKSAEDLANFVDGKGISKEEFLTAFESPAVRRKLGSNDAAMRKAQVSSVPTLVVDDRYKVNLSLGHKPSVEVARQLAELARDSL